MNKVCIKCSQEKSIEEFPIKNVKKGWINSYCKECTKIYKKQHYIDNKVIYLQKQNVYNKRITKENRQKVNEYLLKNPCIDCGEKDIVVLEFDHVRDKKYKTISELVEDSYSWSIIEREIEKCEVRCANCHKRRHFRERLKKKDSIA